MLVVDDSPENRYVSRRALELAGFAVWEARTGTEAVELANRGVDLVLLDVNLPDLHGFEVCRRLKRSERTGHIPVVHLSQTHVGEAARVGGLDAGADAYLTEPVSGPLLVATTRALLRARQTQEALRDELAQARILERLSVALAEATDAHQVVAAVAEHVLTELGARDATVYVVDRASSELRLLHTTLEAGVGREHTVLALDARVPAAEVARTGTASFGDGESLAREYPALYEAFRANGGGGWAAVPAASFARVLGVIVVTFVAQRPPTPPERELLLAVGEQCGQALERSAAHERHRQISESLQASLLPRALPSIPGAQIAARYRAGETKMQVGGDFYDVFARDDDWMLVLGDVCGRGAEAAALTALARHTIRAEARHRQRPSEILAALNEAIVAERGEASTRFITCACMALRRHDDELLVSACVAGHPSPLVIGPDRALTALPSTGPVLGLWTPVDLNDVDARVGPGDSIVLYTDGVTEARNPDGDFFGDERLRALLTRAGSHSGSADQLAENVLAAVTSFSGATHDDIALLVLTNQTVQRPRAHDR